VISIDTYAFALVLVAASCVVAVWRTFELWRKVQALASSLDRRHESYAMDSRATENRLSKLEQQSSVALGARVDELSEAVERLRKTHQRFAGRFHAEKSPDPDGVDDPRWLALRAAQQQVLERAPSPGAPSMRAPNGSNP